MFEIENFKIKCLRASSWKITANSDTHLIYDFCWPFISLKHALPFLPVINACIDGQEVFFQHS